MKPYLAMVLGVIAVLAPMWTLSGFVTVPEHRTGTIADFGTAIIGAVTLYGGVFVGVLIGRKNRRSGFRASFLAGMAGAMVAITLALVASFMVELASTGRLMPKGHTPALLPIFYVVGGILSAFIAAGAGLIAYALESSANS